MNTRTLPPAGHSIPAKAILQSFFRGGNKQDFLRGWFREQPIFWVDSGTGALTFSLKAISRGSNKKQVVLPAYSCPSILSSVIKAGLQPILCDINLHNFGLNVEKLKLKISKDTLAVIAVHLFGIPENILGLRELTEKEGVVLIEDAAQAFGNKLYLNSVDQNTHNQLFKSDPYLGSFGDIGILSFGRGKPLSMLRGGAVLINNPKFKEIIKEEYDQLPRTATISCLGYLLSLVVYSKFFHPNLYWIPQHLPWLRLGETIFSLGFEVRRSNSFVLKVGNHLIPGFNRIAQIRRELAKVYAEKLKGLKEKFLFFPKVDEEAVSLLRFPLVLGSAEKRDRILNALGMRGLGATGMYPVPLNEQQGIPNGLFNVESYPNAKHVSWSILTLPLHEHVKIEDISLICQVIENHI